MGKEILTTKDGREVQANVVGRKFVSNGDGSKEILFVEGFHPELSGSEEKPHEGLTGEETIVVRDVGRTAFVMDGQIP